MTYVLDPGSAFVKFKRAVTHLEALETVIEGKRRKHADTATLRAEFDPKLGCYVARVYALPDTFLLDCAVRVGDCIHNLRSSLDHLAWQIALVASDGRTPPNETRIAFPIYRYARVKKLGGGRMRPGFDGAELIKQVSPTHRALLANFQPYRGGHGKNLARLNQLWNEDKHRSLIRVRGTSIGWSEFAFGASRMVDSDISHAARWLDVGAEVMRFGLAPMPDPRVDVYGEFSPEIFLSDLGPPAEALRHLSIAVGETISVIARAFIQGSQPAPLPRRKKLPPVEIGEAFHLTFQIPGKPK